MFVSGVSGLRFKSWVSQISHSVANRSSPLQHFFKRSCVAKVQWGKDGLHQLVTRFGVLQWEWWKIWFEKIEHCQITNGSNRMGFSFSFVVYWALVTRCKLKVLDVYVGARIGALENSRDWSFPSLISVGGTTMSEATEKTSNVMSEKTKLLQQINLQKNNNNNTYYLMISV